MSSIPPNYGVQSIKIPEKLYSDLTGKPLSNCLVCEKHLLEDGILYLIEKAYKRYPNRELTETIFEYAMCWDCFDQRTESFSEISMQRIGEYFDRHVDMYERSAKMLQEHGTDFDAWTSSCIIKGKPKEDLVEYQLCCLCDGDNLLFSIFPYMIGNEAMDDLLDLLSEQTLGEIDDFTGRYLSLPPDFNLADKLRVLFI